MKGYRFPSMIANISIGIKQGSSQYVRQALIRNLLGPHRCSVHKTFGHVLSMSMLQ